MLKTGFLILCAFAFAIPAPAAQLKVLTFNVWDVPFSAKNIKERMVQICNVFKEHAASKSGWDAILIQEAWDAQDRATLSHCGYENVATTLDDKNTGLMILSKLPIAEVQRMNYSANGSREHFFDGEILVKKGALAVSLSPKSGERLWVVNTHLVSQYLDKKYTYSDQRRMQFRELLKWIADTIPSQASLILGGDFNTGPTGTFHEPLWNDIPDLFAEFNLPQLKQAPYDEKTTYTTTPEEGKLDHLFASPQLKAKKGRVVLREPLSDHRGWETIFKMN